MIGWIRIANVRSIKLESEISFLADQRSRYLLSNAEEIDGRLALKSLSIFGANNSGKTSFIKAVRFLKGVLDGNPPKGNYLNLFSGIPDISISVLFNNLDGLGWLEYGFSYDPEKESFSEEWLYDSNGKKKKVIFHRDPVNGIYECLKHSLADDFPMFSTKLPLLRAMAIKTDNALTPYRDTLTKLSESIEVVDMYNIDLLKTIGILKGDDPQLAKAVSEFVKNADLSIEGFSYGDDDASAEADERSLLDPKGEKLSRLQSVYSGTSVPSLSFDSTGSKKIEALSGYLLEALKKGKTLFVDELDSGLHFKLSRAIVAMFNNPLNQKAQLCFTSHDVSLLDTKKLFRREQICFCFQNKDGAFFKRLSEYKGVRGNAVLRQYANREFGKIPDPAFIDSLFDLLYEEEG